MGEQKVQCTTCFTWWPLTLLINSVRKREAMLNATYLLRREDGQCLWFQTTYHVSGVGGTGESFLIGAVKALVGSVGGSRTHWLGSLQYGCTYIHWRPSTGKESQKVMKTKLHHVKLIIVDWDSASIMYEINLAQKYFTRRKYFSRKECVY